jgi:enoyl-CoA hydratase
MSLGIVRELAYTGRNFSADEALQFGLVNQIFDSQEQMLAGVMKIAAQIAQNSPMAVTGCKQMINYAQDHSINDSLNYMATWQAGMFRGDDIKQTLQAQAMKSAPQYEPLWPKKPMFE